MQFLRYKPKIFVSHPIQTTLEIMEPFMGRSARGKSHSCMALAFPRAREAFRKHPVFLSFAERIWRFGSAAGQVFPSVPVSDWNRCRMTR
jgi:hypothetical protein